MNIDLESHVIHSVVWTIQCGCWLCPQSGIICVVILCTCKLPAVNIIGVDQTKTNTPISLRDFQSQKSLGWELPSQFFLFRYFLSFLALSKYTLAMENHIYIWQVLPQLCCGGICQIWMWFKEFGRHFCKIKNFVYKKINEWSFCNFRNTHPRLLWQPVVPPVMTKLASWWHSFQYNSVQYIIISTALDPKLWTDTVICIHHSCWWALPWCRHQMETFSA